MKLPNCGESKVNLPLATKRKSKESKGRHSERKRDSSLNYKHKISFKSVYDVDSTSL